MDVATRRLAELNAKSEAPEFWNDAAAAQILMRERDQLEAGLSALKKLEGDLEDALTLIELG